MQYISMVTTCRLISKSSCPFTNHLGIVPSSLTTNSINVNFMFHNFYFPSKVYIFVSVFAFFLFLFCGLLVRRSSLFGRFFLFFCWISLGLVIFFEIMCFVRILKSQRTLYVSFAMTDFGFCIYHSFIWLNFDFLLNFQSFLDLYFLH